MNNMRKIALFFLSLLFLSGCLSLKEAGIERGETVFNRVSLRTSKGNKIYYTNRYYGGILIPAGTECTIRDVTDGAITFVAKGNEYVLSRWLIARSTENARLSFEKFFVEDKDTIGLDKVNPKFRENILSGLIEVGMTKEEVLLSVGYPAYLGRRDRTEDDSRESILAHGDWYYLKTGRKKVLLRFRSDKLEETIE